MKIIRALWIIASLTVVPFLRAEEVATQSDLAAMDMGRDFDREMDERAQHQFDQEDQLERNQKDADVQKRLDRLECQQKNNDTDGNDLCL